MLPITLPIREYGFPFPAVRRRLFTELPVLRSRPTVRVFTSPIRFPIPSPWSIQLRTRLWARCRWAAGLPESGLQDDRAGSILMGWLKGKNRAGLGPREKEGIDSMRRSDLSKSRLVLVVAALFCL